MKNKVVGVTKSIYELIRVLEEGEDVLNFTVFYSFAEILESHHFCPAWDFELQYYEIQYDEFYRLQVLQFPFRSCIGDKGHILTEEQIIDLTENIRKEQL